MFLKIYVLYNIKIIKKCYSKNVIPHSSYFFKKEINFDTCSIEVHYFTKLYVNSITVIVL